MAEYTFSRPSDRDIEYVAAHLRQDNRQELTALYGAGHELDVLKRSVRYSELIGCFYVDGIPAAIYGVRSPAAICSVKCVWLLMTDETLKHRLVVGRYTKRFLRAIVAAYGPRLMLETQKSCAGSDGLALRYRNRCNAEYTICRTGNFILTKEF